MKWIDVKAVEADVATYGPVINTITRLVPGESGNALAALLAALGSPIVLEAVINTINAVDGAISPS